MAATAGLFEQIVVDVGGAVVLVGGAVVDVGGAVVLVGGAVVAGAVTVTVTEAVTAGESGVWSLLTSWTPKV